MRVQPVVEVDTALEGGEAVIGEDEDCCLVIGGAQDFAHHRVAASIVFLDHASEFVAARSIVGVGRMLGLAKAPEHVLQPIRGVEEDEEESRLQTMQLMTQHRLALAHRILALREEGRLRVSPVGEPGVILDHTRRVEGAA